MDSLPTTIELRSGLGDCIVAGASVQRLARRNNSKVNYTTNPKLQFLFEGHPDINYSIEPGHKLHWVSQIKYVNLYPLHTMQRFSYQLGYFIDPVDVLDIYMSGKQVVSLAEDKVVCINQFSAEKARRYIPDCFVEYLIQRIKSKGYNVTLVGDNNPYFGDSITDIKDCVDLLHHSKLFIGPVSFLYHLASAIRTPAILFTNYMPEYKFSHFFNTTSINPIKLCRHLCEEKEEEYRNKEKCWDSCKAIDYNINDINKVLELL